MSKAFTHGFYVSCPMFKHKCSIPVTTTIVADIYPYEQWAKMLGFISLVWGISSIAGSLVGGSFVDQLMWH